MMTGNKAVKGFFFFYGLRGIEQGTKRQFTALKQPA